VSEQQRVVHALYYIDVKGKEKQPSAITVTYDRQMIAAGLWAGRPIAVLVPSLVSRESSKRPMAILERRIPFWPPRQRTTGCYC
jgi:hypothetical protein